MAKDHGTEPDKQENDSDGHKDGKEKCECNGHHEGEHDLWRRLEVRNQRGNQVVSF
jgi:hypothetical protein